MHILEPLPYQVSRAYLHRLLAITIRGKSKNENISALQNIYFLLDSYR
jgi:hypothetical protein